MKRIFSTGEIGPATVGMISIIFCLQLCLGSHQCGTNEVSSNTKGAKIGKMVIQDEKCQHVSTLACDSCKDCSICFCKQGYIRAAAGEECITESACQRLHVKWLDEVKKSGVQKFCRYQPSHSSKNH